MTNHTLLNSQNIKLKLIVSLFLFTVVAILGLVFPSQVFAGVGISPADIENTQLLPGQTYTRELVFSRSEADEQIVLELLPDLGKANDWIEFLPSKVFTLDAGIQRTPITLNINVPEGETLGLTEGAIRLKVTTASDTGATVEVVKGAKLDVTLATTTAEFDDFIVRSIRVTDIDNQGIGMLVTKIENTGNMPASPTQATMNILSLDEEPLRTVEITGFTEIAPGKVSEQALNFKLSDLKAGEYFADITIYNDAEPLREERVVVNLPVDTTEKSTNTADNRSDFARFLAENRMISLLLVILIILAGIALAVFLFRNPREESSKTAKKQKSSKTSKAKKD